MPTRLGGSEISVNTSTAGTQAEPSVTALADGGFVVAWVDSNPVDDVVRWQRYDAQGVRVGAEVVIAPPAGQNLASPDIIQNAAGNLLVSFVNTNQTSTNEYSLTGSFLNAVMFPSTIIQTNPSVTVLANGMVITAGEDGSAGNGDAAFTYVTPGLGGGTITIDPSPDLQRNPVVAANPAGTRFVFAFQNDNLNDGDILAVVGNNTFIPGPVLGINGGTAGFQGSASVAWVNNDHFVTTWYDTTGDPNGGGIRAAIHNYDGSVIVAPFTVNATTLGLQSKPTVIGLPNGGFVIAWEDASGTGADPVNGIRLQAFDASGQRIGGEILVNTTLADIQDEPTITALADGRVVVTWVDYSLGFTNTEIKSQIVDPRDGVITGTATDDKLYGHDAVGDVMQGYSGNDTMLGLAGADVMWGELGGDSLFGGRGDDTLYGGASSDILNGGLGSDAIFGGDGIDTISYSTSRAAVTINLLTGDGFGGEAEGDSFDSMENIFGSRFNDTIVGATAATRLEGWLGDDTITGSTMNDTIIGGAGADIMDGLGGYDRTFYNGSTTGVQINLATNINTGGEAQGDVLTNIEEITGSSSGDLIIGNSGNHTFFGGNGSDTLDGGAGADVLYGGAGSDNFVFNLGQSGTTLATMDQIADYTKGPGGLTGDRIILGNNFTSISIGGVTTATTSQAYIDQTNGVASFLAGSGNTLADALSDIANSMTAGGDQSGEFSFFQIGGAGPFFMFISDGVAGVGGNDALIRLNNVTTINTINTYTGNFSILT